MEDLCDSFSQENKRYMSDALAYDDCYNKVRKLYLLVQDPGSYNIR